MKILLGAFLSLVIAGPVFGSSFDDHFEIKRDGGKAVAVMSKSLKRNAAHYFNLQSSSLMQEQGLMKQFTRAQLAAHISTSLRLFNGSLPHSIITKSVNNAYEMDLSLVESELIRSGFMDEFKKKLQKALDLFNPKVIAYLDDSSFYAKKMAIQQVALWALDQAVKRFKDIPKLKLVAYFVRQIINRVHFERVFYQNMMMSYLMSSPAKDFGLTDAEVNHIMSSIFESRIDIKNRSERKKVKDNWKSYGINKYFAMLRNANRRVSSLKILNTVGDRVAFSFSKVSNKKGNYIVNLMDSQRMFKPSPAVAMDVDKPQKVMMIRALLRIAEIGLTTLDIPSNLKNYGEKFIKSFYFNQIRTEGALVGALEKSGETELAKFAMAQSFLLP